MRDKRLWMWLCELPPGNYWQWTFFAYFIESLSTLVSLRLTGKQLKKKKWKVFQFASIATSKNRVLQWLCSISCIDEIKRKFFSCSSNREISLMHFLASIYFNDTTFYVYTNFYVHNCCSKFNLDLARENFASHATVVIEPQFSFSFFIA